MPRPGAKLGLDPRRSLRDYGIPGQIGLEESVFDYIEHLTTVFAQVRRVIG